MALAFDYLSTLEQFGREPNFWCSREYFAKAGWRERRAGEWFTSRIEVIEGDDRMMLPAIPTNDTPMIFILSEDVWADLPGYVDPERQRFFLDRNYIYDPADFAKMEGGKWAVFRKNARKVPRRFVREHDTVLDYRLMDPEIDSQHSTLQAFSEAWLEGVEWPELEDGDVMIEYLFNGENRAMLVDTRRAEILGVNVWDSNHMYTNFRYCFCRPIAFLSEYMRWLFYTKSAEPGKLVNDGGDLGNEKLRDFKLKMNPVKILDIYGWELPDPTPKREPVKCPYCGHPIDEGLHSLCGMA